MHVEADGLVPSGQSVKTNKANWALEDATARMMQIRGIALPIFQGKKESFGCPFFSVAVEFVLSLISPLD